MSKDLIGQYVNAQVERVESYGLYLDFEGQTVIVLIPDVSEDRIPDLGAAFKPGDILRVKILKFVPDRNMFKGSLKEPSCES